MKKKRIKLGTVTEEDILKARRMADREEEIRMYGRPVAGRRMLHKSRKIYDRKRLKQQDLKA